MNPLDKQRQMIERFLVIDDAHERLALVVDRVRKSPPLPEADRIDSNRVHGCSSRVWIAATLEEGRCYFRADADSTLVKGLAALLCEMYDGATAEEVAAVEPELLESLHLSDHLTPTRRHGLAQVRRTIREFAVRKLSSCADS